MNHKCLGVQVLQLRFPKLSVADKEKSSSSPLVSSRGVKTIWWSALGWLTYDPMTLRLWLSSPIEVASALASSREPDLKEKVSFKGIFHSSLPWTSLVRRSPLPKAHWREFEIISSSQPSFSKKILVTYCPATSSSCSFEKDFFTLISNLLKSPPDSMSNCLILSP